ncbi:MAG: sigma-70 family RNA polymerase sigma factor [Actinomycetota bacterium]|nr:sigma-70 family RNA polymerase sigma factor [Actinomycetota bacterium]
METLETEFGAFTQRVEPGLRRALMGAVGVQRVDDATGEALAYAYEHFDRVREMEHPLGYLFRVGQSRTRPRKRVRLFRDESRSMPDVEPGLMPALLHLPPSQRLAVWLVHGCGWTHAEAAEVLGVATSTASTHVARGLERLRRELGVTDVSD